MPRDKNIFTLNPTNLDMPRSVFPRNSQHKTTFNLGEIVPIYLDEILPGDTVSMDLAEVIRTSSPFVSPIMDNLHCDVYFFFVPNRLVWEHWEQFNGQNDTAAWTQTTTYYIPQQDIGISANKIKRNSIGAYMGLPVYDGTLVNGKYGSLALAVNELPLRCYYKVANDWFIDENNIGPKVFSIGDNPNTAIKYADSLVKAARFHDLFSSCLPAPQKGASVTLPLGTIAPVISQGSTLHSMIDPVRVQSSNGTLSTFNNLSTDVQGFVFAHTGQSQTGSVYGINQSNLVADLRNATAATINALRTAFQVQKLLERDARGGTRYIELLRAHFGVTSPDARLQRAEYLAGQRFRIQVDQVIATADSGSSGSSVLGEVGAMSKTAGAGSMFTKSFVEHGYLLGVAVIRQDHTYTGLNKLWLKKERFDFYYPVLANIGEVPVMKAELEPYTFTAGSNLDLTAVFGYNEAWYEYRFRPSMCSGMFNVNLAGSLNSYVLTDIYSSAPGLNATFINESPDFLDRALAVGHATADQFIADFYFKAKFSRVMPLYSIPGLIDHH